MNSQSRIVGQRIAVNVGDRYGFWEVVGDGSLNKYGIKVYECRCECGVMRNVTKSSLIIGQSRSCGCKKRELSTETRQNNGKKKWGVI